MIEMTESLQILVELEKQKDEIAKIAEELCQRQRSLLPRRTQFENLRVVASSTESIEELKSYIYYQIGRERYEPGFGKDLLKAIDEVAKLIPDVRGRAGAVRLFTGYLSRYAVYYGR